VSISLSELVSIYTSDVDKYGGKKNAHVSTLHAMGSRVVMGTTTHTFISIKLQIGLQTLQNMSISNSKYFRERYLEDFRLKYLNVFEILREYFSNQNVESKRRKYMLLYTSRKWSTATLLEIVYFGTFFVLSSILNCVFVGTIQYVITMRCDM
jgi:hypothetical protein